MSFDEIEQLDYLVLLCSRIQETRRFYSDVIGFPVVEDRENWISFRMGSTRLTLRPRGPWSVCDDGPRPEGSAAVQLAFRMSRGAVDRCHADLLARGIPILRPPTDLPNWRHRTLFLRDPEDNIVELFAHI